MKAKTKIASFLSWTLETLGLRAQKDYDALRAPESKSFTENNVPVSTMPKKDVRKKNIKRHEQHK